MAKHTILCFGEIVWDALPSGIFLGGAPLNVAYHLNRLGHEAYPVSRTGNDFLGDQTRRNLMRAHVSTKLVQKDKRHMTGAVVVSIGESGDASYEILRPAAWDFIEETPELLEAAMEARALVYGSLATRSEANARLLGHLIEQIPLTVCDVNLRKPHDDPANALAWAAKAGIVKLNDEELDRLTPASTADSLEEKARALAGKLNCRTLVVTRGGEGAYVLEDGNGISRPAPKVEVADTVGAGDAFTAGFLSARLNECSLEGSLEKALKLGGFVAGRSGAQPSYDPAEIFA